MDLNLTDAEKRVLIDVLQIAYDDRSEMLYDYKDNDLLRAELRGLDEVIRALWKDIGLG